MYPILYEDKHFLAINKPSGVVVNRAASVKGKTIQDWMDKKIGSLGSGHDGATSNDIGTTDEFVRRSGVVHRLDKETSGILLLSKHPQSFERLKSQFKDRTIRKTYIALSHGRIAPDTGSIHAPVGRLPWNRMRFGVLPSGRDAYTSYSARAFYTNALSAHYTLVTVFPKTGRTHQIRVHLQYIGHPVVSDILYAGKKQGKRDRQWCPRLFLHAESLDFVHPMSKKPMTIKSPLPEDLQSVLSELTLSEQTS